ncbi:MAG TPA: helix-turn-helix domain-containing protein [Gemmatimonadota bacterium]|nr:helix-turn-helix domain-containing protein [Gemmatimonadota bacterium]
MRGLLRVDVVGDPGLCPADPGIECRAAPMGAPARDPLPDVVIVDLDRAGERAADVVREAADPARGVVVLTVSRDPALACLALAAGATDYALLPRDAAWLEGAVRRERDLRAGGGEGAPGGADRLVVDVPAPGLAFEEYEKRIIEHALSRAGWNRSRAARELEISRPRLLRKIERYGLTEPPEAGSGPAPA